MNRDKNLPMTETAYYILLAVKEPAHGYSIMQKVEALSDGQVRLAAGTLYGAVENLLSKGLITSVPSDDARRKVYALSDRGENILRMDYQRMAHMISITDTELNKGAIQYEKI
jgi:DNA-binding PadR family transcriptional regulator